MRLVSYTGQNGQYMRHRYTKRSLKKTSFWLFHITVNCFTRPHFIFTEGPRTPDVRFTKQPKCYAPETRIPDKIMSPLSHVSYNGQTVIIRDVQYTCHQLSRISNIYSVRCMRLTNTGRPVWGPLLYLMCIYWFKIQAQHCKEWNFHLFNTLCLKIRI